MAEQQYYMKLTEKGLNAYARAVNTNQNVNFSFVAVGDGNGQAVKPDSNWTALVHEVWRDAPILVEVDNDNPRIVIVEMYIPHAIGGFTVREVGLFDREGTMLAVGNYPDSYKPTVENGAGVEMRARFMVEHTNAANTVLKIDPAIVMASREYAERVAQVKIDEHNANAGSHDTFARKTVKITAGSGLQGGGDLSASRTISLGDWEGKSAEDVLKVIELAGMSKKLKTPEQLHDAIQKLIADKAPDLSPFVFKTQIATVKEPGLAPRLATETEVKERKGMGLVNAAQLGLLGFSAFFSQTSGTFTVPAGVTQLCIILTGGGGSGAFVPTVKEYEEASGGSGAGTAIGFVAVEPAQKIPFIIGAGGIAPTANMASDGGDGGTSSCLKMIAYGGYGGAYAKGNMVNAPGLPGGQASGGLLSLSGSPSSHAINVSSTSGGVCGSGGDSFWGGGGAGLFYGMTGVDFTKWTQQNVDGGAPGAGGGGKSLNNAVAAFADINPGAGADGAILILY